MESFKNVELIKKANIYFEYFFYKIKMKQELQKAKKKMLFEDLKAKLHFQKILHIN